MFLKWSKNLSHFSQNVWKYRLMNTAMVSFNTTVRQMAEMFQWPKCPSKKKTGCKYLHLLGIPFAKIALHCTYVFLLSMQSIMSVYYPHTATFMLAILNYIEQCFSNFWKSVRTLLFNKNFIRTTNWRCWRIAVQSD